MPTRTGADLHSRRSILRKLIALLAAAGSPAAAQGQTAVPSTSPMDHMIEVQLRGRGISDARVLAAMRKLPRERFVPAELAGRAYDDRPLPIGHGQTISQPFVVAFMTEALRLRGDEKVLEIGTGSGYQAAVLAELAREVYTIEIVEPLARTAAEILNQLGYANLHLRTGDGYRGWPEAAPFDAILITAAPEHIPEPLIDQLAPGGRMVLPLGGRDDALGPGLQELVLVERDTSGRLRRHKLRAVRFVPMTGEAQQRPRERP